MSTQQEYIKALEDLNSCYRDESVAHVNMLNTVLDCLVNLNKDYLQFLRPKLVQPYEESYFELRDDLEAKNINQGTFNMAVLELVNEYKEKAL